MNVVRILEVVYCLNWQW